MGIFTNSSEPLKERLAECEKAQLHCPYCVAAMEFINDVSCRQTENGTFKQASLSFSSNSSLCRTSYLSAGIWC